MNATGWPWRFPDGEVIGVFMSAWASTQMTHRSGHCWAWPLTDPIARLGEERHSRKYLQFPSNAQAGCRTFRALFIALFYTCDLLPTWPECARRRRLFSPRWTAFCSRRPRSWGTSRPCRVRPARRGESWGRQSHEQSSLRKIKPEVTIKRLSSWAKTNAGTVTLCEHQVSVARLRQPAAPAQLLTRIWLTLQP